MRAIYLLHKLFMKPINEKIIRSKCMAVKFNSCCHVLIIFVHKQLTLIGISITDELIKSKQTHVTTTITDSVGLQVQLQRKFHMFVNLLDKRPVSLKSF